MTDGSPRLREKPLVQALSEAFWHFEELAVTEQPNNIPHAVVDGGAVAAAREVALNLESEFRREIVLQRHTVCQGRENRRPVLEVANSMISGAFG